MSLKGTFATSGNVQSDGRNLTFIANTGRVMDNGQTVDLSTLTVPLMDGSTKLVSDLSDRDNLALPLLIDHMPSVTTQAGRVMKLWIDDTNGLMALAKLSDTESGKLVMQLAGEDMLTNSFSIDIEYMAAPGKDGVIHDGNLQEISVVYKGMDPGAAFKSLNSKKGNTMQLNLDTTELQKHIAQFKLTEKEKTDLLAEIQDAMQGAADAVTEAVNSASESDDDTDEDKEDGGDAGTKTDPPAEPAQASNSKTTRDKLGKTMLVINNPGPKAKGNAVSEIARFSNDRKNYLDSKAAFNDYANFLFSHPSDRDDAGMDVAKQWSEFAKKKLAEHSSFGIDNDSVESMIPKSVVDTINDIFDQQGTGVWQSFNKTGLDTPPTIGENEIGLDDDRGRAHGYEVADYGTQKKEQTISLAERSFRMAYVYKYIALNRGDLRRTQTPGALLKYVLSEIPARMIQTVERASTINSVDHTAQPNDWSDMAMFRSMYDDSLETASKAGDRIIPGNRFALTYTQKPGESLVETFRRAAGKVKAAGAKSLITTEETLANVMWSKDNDGRTIIPIGGPINTILGVSDLFTPEWWTERDTAKALGIIYVGGQYDVFGDSSIDAYTNFALRTNQNEFLQEMYTGGGLRTIRSAVIIKAAPTTPTTRSFGYTGNAATTDNTAEGAQTPQTPAEQTPQTPQATTDGE